MMKEACYIMPREAAQEGYKVRVRAEVEIMKENLSDALIEAGKKITGAGCIVAGTGCIYKALQEENLGWGIVGVIFEAVGICLLFS